MKHPTESRAPDPAPDSAALTGRHLLAGSAATLSATFGTSLLPSTAKVPVPYDWNASPPVDRRADYIEWMVANRDEDRQYLGQRWDRLGPLIAAKDLSGR